MKVVWLSDPHFTAEGDVFGCDPRARLNAAIDHICAQHSDADACVISGDMVNRETQEDYSVLAESLARLPVPVYPMMGNHDDRALLRRHLPLPENSMPDFVQYAVTSPSAKLLCLDTHKIGSGAGEFCEKRTAWLRKELNAAGDTPVYLFLHHPPLPLGLPMQDNIQMEGGADFLSLIASFDCVNYMFMGHVHRPITGAINGIPYATMRSLTYQAPAPRPEWDWDSFTPSREAPNLGVITLAADGAVILHYEQFGVPDARWYDA